MRVLAISHQRDAGPGVFAEAITAERVELDVWQIAETQIPSADPLSYDAVLTFGGAMHADQEARHSWLAREKRLLGELLGQETPLLAVCLGAQLLAEAAGGHAARVAEPERGWFEVEVGDSGADDPLLGALAPSFEAFEWHSYECVVPAQAVVLARNPACVQAFRVDPSAWGIQFHAEVSAPDAARWIDRHRADEEGGRSAIDSSSVRAETARKIAGWNRLGRELCGRWLELARAS